MFFYLTLPVRINQTGINFELEEKQFLACTCVDFEG